MKTDIRQAPLPPVIRPVVELRAVGHAYEARLRSPALEDVTLSVGEDEFVSIVGPTGCGKSTLLKVIAGLIRPAFGEVVMNGGPIAGPADADVAMVFQRSTLLPWRTIAGNIELVRQVRRERLDDDWEARRDALLGTCRLDRFVDRYPRELSVGMRQMASFCLALLAEPGLLLLDEPFASCDELTRVALARTLTTALEASPRPVIFVTHSLREAVELGTRVVVMGPRPGSIIGEYDTRADDPHDVTALVESVAACLSADWRP